MIISKGSQNVFSVSRTDLSKKKSSHVFLRVFLVCLVFIIGTEAHSQTTIKNYNILVAGIKVGQFTAKEIVSGSDKVRYEINSHVDINLWVYKMKSRFISKINYKNGKMINARVDMLSNKGDFFAESVQTNLGYRVKGEHQEGSFDRVLNESITSSVAKLYFHEPKNESRVFAEFYGGLMDLKEIGKGVYHGKMPNNEDTFYYENGILVKSVKKNRFKNLEFVHVDTVVAP